MKRKELTKTFVMISNWKKTHWCLPGFCENMSMLWVLNGCTSQTRLINDSQITIVDLMTSASYTALQEENSSNCLLSKWAVTAVRLCMASAELVHLDVCATCTPRCTPAVRVPTQQTRGIDPILSYCWASVKDVGTTLTCGIVSVTFCTQYGHSINPSITKATNKEMLVSAFQEKVSIRSSFNLANMLDYVSQWPDSLSGANNFIMAD